MIIDFIIWLVIGGIAGWLAGLLVKGYGFGLLGYRRRHCRRDHCRLAVTADRFCYRWWVHRGNRQRRHWRGDSLADNRVVQEGLRANFQPT